MNPKRDALLAFLLTWFLLAMGYQQLALAPPGAITFDPLRAWQAPCDDAPGSFGIVDFELAATPKCAERILRQWSGAADLDGALQSEVVAQVRQGLYWDYAFLLAYGLFLAMLVLAVQPLLAKASSALARGLGRGRLPMLVLIAAAAFADALENRALLQFLDGGAPGYSLQLARFAAAAKFLMLAMACAYVLLAWAASLLRVRASDSAEDTLAWPTFEDHGPPKAQCDIIMKGGTTSGVVYPWAIAKLAERFRFRALGGASAGAIGAAAAAAAEYGRSASGAGGAPPNASSMLQLGRLTQELARRKQGRTRLERLFTAHPDQQGLVKLLMAGLSSGDENGLPPALRWLCAAIRRYWFVAVIAGALGLLLIDGAGRSADQVLARSIGLFGALAAAALLLVVALVLSIYVDLRSTLASNQLGLVSGTAPDALSHFLHEQIQTLSGKEAPLTFGDLWSVPIPTPDAADAGKEAEPQTRAWQRGIDLRLMTTAASLHRGYSFPLEPEDEFFFRRDELERLLPGPVVEHMVVHSPASEDGRYRLPAMADLPILLPVRMSLAFPILLCAVPLWRRSQGGWERIWFTDGGAISNFPVHYFDSVMPTRPTFCFNLQQVKRVSPDGFEILHRFDEQQQAPSHRIDDPKDGRPRPQRFLSALVCTVHGWSDRAQQAVPGYRERVATIQHTADEGGLNLRMGPRAIHALAMRGYRAAAALGQLLDPSDPTSQWGTHRWIRFRTNSRLFREALLSLRTQDTAISAPYDVPTLIAAAPVYPLNVRAQPGSAELYHRLVDLGRWIESWEAGGLPLDADHAQHPRPTTELRVKPRV